MRGAQDSPVLSEFQAKGWVKHRQDRMTCDQVCNGKGKEGT